MADDLATGLDGPAGLVLDSAGTLYFTEIKTGEIKAVPKTGGTVTTIAAALINPYDLLLEEVPGSKVLYFTEFNPTIGKIEKACLICPIGLPGDVDSLATDQPGSISLALDDLGDPYVYYLNREGRQVMRLLKDSGDPQTPFVLADASDGLSRPQDIVRVSTDLFFTDAGIRGTSGTGAVRCVSTSGMGLTTVVDGLDQPGAIETDGADLFFAEVAPGTGTGKIKKVSADCMPNGSVTILAHSLDEPGGIVKDATHVYFADRGLGRIWKVLDSDGTQTLVAEGLNLPTHLTADGSFLYFTETQTIF